MHREPESEVRIVVQVRARRDDPVDEPGFDQRDQRCHAEAGRRERASDRESDRHVRFQHSGRQQLAGLAQPCRVVCEKRPLDQVCRELTSRDGAGIDACAGQEVRPIAGFVPGLMGRTVLKASIMHMTWHNGGYSVCTRRPAGSSRVVDVLRSRPPASLELHDRSVGRLRTVISHAALGKGGRMRRDDRGRSLCGVIGEEHEIEITGRNFALQHDARMQPPHQTSPVARGRTESRETDRSCPSESASALRTARRACRIRPGR